MAKNKTPIFWIWGNMRQCRQTWDGIVSHVTAQSEDKPEIQVMFGGYNPEDMKPSLRWTTADDVVFALRNRSFCEGPQIIKVCGLPDTFTDLADWFHIVNGENVLVIQSPFGYTKPGSKRWISAKTTKFYKKVKAEGFLIEHPIEVNEGAAIDWVESIVQENNKKISRKTARLLVRTDGTNLDILENAAIKLCTYKRGKEIVDEDVEACSFAHLGNETVWQFLEQLDRGDHLRALEFLQKFYAEGDGAPGESFYGRVNKLFGALLQHYQFLMVLSDLGGSSFNADQVEKACESIKKTTPTKLAELKRKEITFGDLEPRFSKQYITTNLRQDSIRLAAGKKKSENYRALSFLYDCIHLCRLNSGSDARIRLCLDIFALVASGQLTASNASRVMYNKVLRS